MSDLAERLRENPELFAYIAADRIEELEHRMSEKDFLPVLRAQADIIEEQRQEVEGLEAQEAGLIKRNGALAAECWRLWERNRVLSENTVTNRRIKELEADRTRLSALVIKHCPQEHHDWEEVFNLTKHLVGK